MTDVIKSNGKKEQFSEQKVKKSIESAVKDAGFSPQEKMNVIDHASQDAIQMAQNKNQVQTKQIRDTILSDLEQDDQQVANAWKQYERQHGINY
ncbi:ATP cone domain-containing protein [Methanobacterium sp. MBAC-LM]|jgi:transcriptional repressor NrdR|uniref:ATP cone domain-containing protein n=1 Tax=Methanobacterium sp. MBAC-LM TaxID=3412034 RepID=UPI003C727C60